MGMEYPHGEPRGPVARGLEASSLWIAGHGDEVDRPHRAELLAREHKFLEPLTPSGRMISLVAHGVAATHGVTADSASAERRQAALLERADVLEYAIGGRLRDAVALEGLWHDLATQTELQGAVAGAALAIARAIPLSLERLDQLQLLGEEELEALGGLAVGRAARAGDQGALAMVRDGLADPRSEAVAVGLVKGVGDGLWRAGVDWVVRRARVAISDDQRWAEAARRVLRLSLGVDDLSGLLSTGFGGCELDDDAERWLGEIEAEALPDEWRAVHRQLHACWWSWPPPMRAAVLKRHLAAGAGVTELSWHTDRAPSVIAAALGDPSAPFAALEEEDKRQLVQIWSSHPDASVRDTIAQVLAAVGGLPGEEVDDDADRFGDSNLVTLPASALARNELDALRAALWSGDVDDVVRLAQAVPEDQRIATREALFAAVEIPNAALRRACVEAIGLIGSAPDGSRLMAIARRYRALEGTVAAALRAVGAVDQVEPLAELYRRRLKWADDEAVDDFCELAGPARVPHLLAALETRFYPGARAGAARGMARSRVQEGIFALRTRGLSDTHQAARMAALDALQALAGTSPSQDEVAGYALLFRAADDLDNAVERACEAGAAALPGLRRTLAKGSWKRRRAACEVLGQLPGPEADATLLDALLDVDEDVRLTAVEALTVRGWKPSTAAELTMAALASRRPAELIEAEDQLEIEVLERGLELGGHVFRTELLEILERLPDWRPAGRVAGLALATKLDGVSALGEEAGLKAVLHALDQTWQAIPHRARLSTALGSMDAATLSTELVEGGWGWRAREALCQALGRGGEDACIDGLESQVLDPDDDVRKAALHALALVGTTAAARGITRGFESPFQEDRELVGRTLAAVGPDAWVVIEALIDDPWWEGRQGAAIALSHWKHDRRIAVDCLARLAVDPEYRVSESARSGLSRHGLAPRPAAIRAAVSAAQAFTVEGLEWWLGASTYRVAGPDLAVCIDNLIEEVPLDGLPQRLDLIAVFGAEHLAGWLESAARGVSSEHVGVRLAAADALRRMTRQASLATPTGGESADASR